MRTMTHVTLVLVALLGTGCRPQPRPAAVSGDSAAAADPFVGQWRAQLRFSTGAFAPVEDLEFMYVFNQGGTMTESSNYDASPPVPPAYGIWRRTGDRQYEVKYEFYVTKAPGKFDEIANGGGWAPAGRGVFVEQITVSGDGRSFTSTVRYQQFAADGRPTEGGGEAVGKGTRLAF